MEPATDSTKKKKKTTSTKQANGRDRLSNLPQSVLHHILSFLDTKDVVQTSVLSTKWRYVWTSLPFLNFKCNLLNLSNTSTTIKSSKGLSLTQKKKMSERFKHFVDQVLILRDSISNIQSFRLSFYRDKWDDCDIQSRFYTWIRYALRHNVRQLYLDVSIDEELQWPHCLLTCCSKSLVVLELHNHKLKIPHDSMLTLFPSLKTLILYGVWFEEGDLLNKIFLSCPVLESLTLVSCEVNQINLDDVSAPKLNHLVIENIYACADEEVEVVKHEYSVNICAPNLISFRCKDRFSATCYTFEKLLLALANAEVHLETNVSDNNNNNYVELDCEMRNVFAQQAMKFLRALQKVEALTLSACFVEVVPVAPALLEIQYYNLKCLKIETTLSRESINAMTCILQIAPNIESLFLETKDIYRCWGLKSTDWDEVRLTSAEIEDFWEAGVSLQHRIYHLKFVEIRGVQGSLNELLLLEILLKYAISLRKVVLHSEVETNCPRKRLIKYTEHLLTLPRASTTLAILLT